MLKWAFVGASNIASEWMVGAVRAAGDEVVAVVSGSAARAAGFAQQHGIAHALDQLDGLRRLELDAVYVSNSNDRHEQAARDWIASTDEPNARLIEASRPRADWVLRWND